MSHFSAIGAFIGTDGKPRTQFGGVITGEKTGQGKYTITLDPSIKMTGKPAIALTSLSSDVAVALDDTSQQLKFTYTTKKAGQFFDAGVTFIAMADAYQQ